MSRQKSNGAIEEPRLFGLRDKLGHHGTDEIEDPGAAA